MRNASGLQHVFSRARHSSVISEGRKQKQMLNLQGFSGISWQMKLTTWVSFQAIPAYKVKTAIFNSHQSFLTIHGADSEVKSCERRGQLVRLGRLLQELQNRVLFLRLRGCNVPQRRPLIRTRLQLKQGKEQPFKFAALMVTTATIIQGRDLSAPLTALCRELTAPGSPRTSESCWSREDLVLSGRAESRWKCLLSIAISTQRGKQVHK